ncbi:hypothetical protein VPHK436_0056 [Vibrio phage K436]
MPYGGRIGGGGGRGATGAHMTNVVFDKKVTGGNQYIITMSDSSTFKFTIPEKEVLDIKSLKDGSVPVFNAKTGELVDSGVFAKDGDLTIAPNTLRFGTHEMSSSPENVMFYNTATDNHYAPLWQEVAPNTQLGYIRALSTARDITRNALINKVLTNPDFIVPVKKNETVWSITIYLDQPTKAIEMKVLGANKLMGRSIWRGDYAAGEHELVLKTPWDFRKGVTYRVQVSDPDGGDIKLKGSSTLPYWKISRSVWTELVIADRTWVAAQMKVLSDEIDAVKVSIGNMQQDQLGKLHSMDQIVQGLKALGYLSGTTPKPPVVGPTANIQAYVFFSAGAAAPDSIPSTAHTHSGDTFSITKSNDDPEYVYVVIPATQAGKASRVAEKGGLPSIWRKISKVYNGTRYEVLRSPSPFVERNPTFVLYP